MSLRILSVMGPAWVQDLGRPGHMHEGMPWGGALVPELAAATNAAVGNPAHLPLLEFFGVLSCRATGALAIDGQRVQTREVRNARVRSGQRVSYLAVAGGIRVPRFMGGYGTLPTAGLGGYQGRSLRHGDRLELGKTLTAKARCGAALGRIRTPDWEAPTGVRPGPDWDNFSSDEQRRFLSQGWISAEPSDRTGLRLRGEPLVYVPQVRSSRPMLRGAIQVPPNGQPVVLGPDHPVTGGYAVIAVVEPQDLGSLFGRAAGRSVRFVLADDGSRSP